ncbi:MAG: hypothetical protein U5K75_00045 [Ahrensia sp.]|nr:hypothetical protein [Ahrensia sp.]
MNGELADANSINDLLYSIEVISLMTMAVKADELQRAVQYVELTNALFEMPHTGKAVNHERMLEHARMAMMIDPTLIPTAEELQAQQSQENQEMMAQMAGQAAIRAAPQLVQAAGIEQVAA